MRSTSPSPTRRPSTRSPCCAQTEGIIPALESAHAVAHVIKIAKSFPSDVGIVINLSGRGDKDCVEVARLIGKQIG